MSPEAFCYWLQGAIELGGLKEMSPQELQVVKDHLKLVFEKRTPEYGSGQQLPPNTASPLPDLRPFYEGVGTARQGQVPYTVRDNTSGVDLPLGVTISC